MVTLFVMSTGQLWIGCDKNVSDYPAGASGSAGVVKARFAIDDNPGPQQMGTLSSTFVWTRDGVDENPTATDGLDAGSGGTKFVDYH